MAHAQHMVVVDRSISEVFDFLADGLNNFTLEVKPRGLMVLMMPMINKQVASEAANIGNLPAAIAGRLPIFRSPANTTRHSFNLFCRAPLTWS
ncbi:hypothetical protein BH09ACT6_BH09ACT6_15330 [soil metagenome]